MHLGFFIMESRCPNNVQGENARRRFGYLPFWRANMDGDESRPRLPQPDISFPAFRVQDTSSANAQMPERQLIFCVSILYSANLAGRRASPSFILRE